MTLELGICAVVLTDVFHCVRGPDDLCRTFLPFRRPHCAAPKINAVLKVYREKKSSGSLQIGQKSTVRMIQFE